MRGGIVISFARMNRILELDAPNRRARVQPGLINRDLSLRDGGVRSILRAGSVEPEDLDDRRQRRHERGRSALPLLRHDDEPRARRRVRRPRRRTRADQRRRCGLRPHRPARRQRRDARRADGHRRPAVAAAAQRCGSASQRSRTSRPPPRRFRRSSAPASSRPRSKSSTPSSSARSRRTIASGSRPMPARCCSSRWPARTKTSPSTSAPSRGSLATTARCRGVPRATPREREILWASRKGAAGALGRLAPNYYIQDACVPRTRLPQALHAVVEIARAPRPHGRQRLPRRRRQSASAAPVRPARSAPGGGGRRGRDRDSRGLHRPRRNDQRRARDRLREARDAEPACFPPPTSRRWGACAPRSILTALQSGQDLPERRGVRRSACDAADAVGRRRNARSVGVTAAATRDASALAVAQFAFGGRRRAAPGGRKRSRRSPPLGRLRRPGRGGRRVRRRNAAGDGGAAHALRRCAQHEGHRRTHRLRAARSHQRASSPGRPCADLARALRAERPVRTDRRAAAGCAGPSAGRSRRAGPGRAGVRTARRAIS